MIRPTKSKDLGTLTGPLLLFGGAYSNLQAVQALRERAAALGIPPTNVVCTGDSAGYCADPRATLDLIEDWGVHAIAGNVETNLVAGQDDCGCGFGEDSRCDYLAKRWYKYARENVSARNLAYMAGLPDILTFTYGGRRVVVLHGSPRNQSEFVWKSTAASLKRQFCADAGATLGFNEQSVADVVVGGHCGLPFASDLGVEFAEGEGTTSEPDQSPGNAPVRRTSKGSSVPDPRPASLASASFWLNPGVVGMPANDGTPRTWFMTLDDTGGTLTYQFHALDYNHRAAKSRMLADRRLPVAYAATLTTGIWDNTEIMPPEEEAHQGLPLDLDGTTNPLLPFKPAAAPASAPESPNPLAHPVQTGHTRALSTKTTTMSTYSNPKDLRSFGKIADWQPEMGQRFFDWYAGVTEGDTALSEREKALIALAVSHAIQCSYCIDAYTTNSLQAGADEEQMMEAVHVAAAVKAGTTLIYARQMQRQVEKVTM